jgi:NADH-quinone oxidoreductase subunit A
MIELTLALLIFLAVGIFFIFFHLMMGKVIRPARPSPDKLTIYECGEPTIGSSWIQFDLRFYVVALLFVIFDVEVAFFFPWAVVFGKANQLARADLPEQDRVQLTKELVPREQREVFGRVRDDDMVIKTDGARELAWLSFWDILVFFGVLLVGFAYLWRRGDLDWVRSTAAEQPAVAEEPPLPAAEKKDLVGMAQGT